MLVHNGHFYVVEANHGQILRVNPGGHVEMFVDLATLEGHVVPTAIAFHDDYIPQHKPIFGVLILSFDWLIQGRVPVDDMVPALVRGEPCRSVG